MDYFVGESSFVVNANMDANILASNLGKCSHTGKYEDLNDKLGSASTQCTSKKMASPGSTTNPTLETIRWSVARDGYVPVSIIGFDVSNVIKNSGSSRVSTCYIYLTGNECVWAFRVLGRGAASSRQYKVTAQILYAKNFNDKLI